MDFKLNVDEIIGKTINDVELLIDSHYKRSFKELTYLSMLTDSTTNEAIRHGVYIIFDDTDKAVYVGKCESVHFVDRLGFHFGMSPNYKYTFLSKLVDHRKFTKNFDGYVEASSTISDYKIILINSNGKGNEFIRKLEKIFMVIYQPELNSLPKKIKRKKFKGSEEFQISLY